MNTLAVREQPKDKKRFDGSVGEDDGEPPIDRQGENSPADGVGVNAWFGRRPSFDQQQPSGRLACQASSLTEEAAVDPLLLS
jgi:hypothetical protein